MQRIGLEPSSIGLWLYCELHQAGLPMIVVETRHMHVSLSAMRNKTDRNDARGIAQMMRLGLYLLKKPSGHGIALPLRSATNDIRHGPERGCLAPGVRALCAWLRAT